MKSTILIIPKSCSFWHWSISIMEICPVLSPVKSPKPLYSFSPTKINWLIVKGSIKPSVKFLLYKEIKFDCSSINDE